MISWLLKFFLRLVLGLPLHDALSLSQEEALLLRFRGDVCKLVFGGDLVHADASCPHVFPKMVHPDANVLGTRAHLWQPGHLQSCRVIFKHFAMNGGLIVGNLPSYLFRVVEELHHVDDLSQTFRHCVVLTFC